MALVWALSQFINPFPTFGKWRKTFTICFEKKIYFITTPLQRHSAHYMYWPERKPLWYTSQDLSAPSAYPKNCGWENNNGLHKSTWSALGSEDFIENLTTNSFACIWNTNRPQNYCHYQINIFTSRNQRFFVLVSG